MVSYLIPIFVVASLWLHSVCAQSQTSADARLTVGRCWCYLAGQPESPSLCLRRAGPPARPCEERDSFIPAGRNVIISITDEVLQWGYIYISFLFSSYFMSWQSSSILQYVFLSFIVLILPSHRDFDWCCCCCYIWHWLRRERALREFITCRFVLCNGVLNIFFLPVYNGWIQE